VADAYYSAKFHSGWIEFFTRLTFRFVWGDFFRSSTPKTPARIDAKYAKRRGSAQGCTNCKV